MRNAEAMAFSVLVQLDLVDEHASQKNCHGWKPLLLVVVDEQCLIAKDVEPISHSTSSFTDLQKLTFFRDNRIKWNHNALVLLRLS